MGTLAKGSIQCPDQFISVSLIFDHVSCRPVTHYSLKTVELAKISTSALQKAVTHITSLLRVLWGWQQGFYPHQVWY